MFLGYTPRKSSEVASAHIVPEDGGILACEQSFSSINPRPAENGNASVFRLWCYSGTYESGMRALPYRMEPLLTRLLAARTHRLSPPTAGDIHCRQRVCVFATAGSAIMFHIICLDIAHLSRVLLAGRLDRNLPA